MFSIFSPVIKKLFIGEKYINVLDMLYDAFIEVTTNINGDKHLFLREKKKQTNK